MRKLFCVVGAVPRPSIAFLSHLYTLQYYTSHTCLPNPTGGLCRGAPILLAEKEKGSHLVLPLWRRGQEEPPHCGRKCTIK